MDRDFIHIRIDDYEADIPAVSLPEWTAPKFRKLLKLIRDTWSTYPEEWYWMEERLKTGIEDAKARLEAAKEAYQEKYIPIPPKWQTEEAQYQRALNPSLKSDVKQAERQLKRWKNLKTIYDKERNKRK